MERYIRMDLKWLKCLSNLRFCINGSEIYYNGSEIYYIWPIESRELTRSTHLFECTVKAAIYDLCGQRPLGLYDWNSRHR